jgi:hypothetical protein
MNAGNIPAELPQLSSLSSTTASYSSEITLLKYSLHSYHMIRCSSCIRDSVLDYLRDYYHRDSTPAFTTISLFNLLQLPFTFLPLGLAKYSQSLVSTNRMLQFFLSEELVP